MLPLRIYGDDMTAEAALRRMRRRIFTYPDNKIEQAQRVLLYLKHRMMRSREIHPYPVGQWSGLTRGELRRSGTCETDWY